MTEVSGEVHRIDRSAYPQIIQSARWSDEDNGTNHFEPGVGFIVDDPDGLMVPARWLPHLDTIETALAGLDHAAPHPLDIDNIEWLAREAKEPTIYESAAYCFCAGEHTPVTAMANSSPGLWTANRFLNEYFEGWLFDPTAGYENIRVTQDALAKAESALSAVDTGVFRIYRTGNNRQKSIEADDGEACDIMHSDITIECRGALKEVRAALSPASFGGSGK